ncbi:MAG: TSUP family transporter [Polyangiaceae bacterium]
MTLLLLLFGTGLLAGAISSVAGLGGGMLLLSVTSLAMGPLAALATTSPALLVGNLHRTWLHRKSIDWALARAFALGALPGAVCGALAAVSVPVVAIQCLLVVSTLFAVVRSLGYVSLRAPRQAMAPAGFVIGGLTGTAGGAGVLAGPLFLSAGLSGDAYAGTIASGAVAMHVGRIAGYGAGGLLEPELWGSSGLIAVGLVLGNGLGGRLRRALAGLPNGLVEHVVLALSVLFAVLGLGRA